MPTTPLLVLVLIWFGLSRLWSNITELGNMYLVWVVLRCLCLPPVRLPLEVSRSRKACGLHTCLSNTWDWSNPRRSAIHVSPKPPQLEAWIFWTSSGHKGLWGRHCWPPPFVVTISLWWLIRCQHGSAAASGRWVGLATQHCSVNGRFLMSYQYMYCKPAGIVDNDWSYLTNITWVCLTWALGSGTGKYMNGSKVTDT